MKHPTPEAWMAYLYNDFTELPAEARADAEAHLAVCAACRGEVEQWRATMGVLDADVVASVPISRPPAVIVSFPRAVSAKAPVPRWWPWAVAAGVLAAASFLAGRSLGPSREEVRQELGRLREQLTREISAELRATQQGDWAAISAASVNASVAAQRELAASLITGITEARIADRNGFLATLERVDRQRADEMAQLRDGFQLLAEKTGGAFQETDSRLKALASSLPASSSPAAP